MLKHMTYSCILRYFTSVCIIFSLSFGAQAQQKISFIGTTKDRALLKINDMPPLFFEKGETHWGVTLLRFDSATATISAEGRTLLLYPGITILIPNTHFQALQSTQITQPIETPPITDPSQVILHASDNGHFYATVTINHHSLSMLIDTGATTLVLDETHAQSAQLNLSKAQPIQTHTTNGVVKGYRISVPEVRIENLLVKDVDTIVLNQKIPYPLLGMSLISKIKMTTEPGRLILQK